MTQLVYGDRPEYAIDTTTLPESVLVALAQRTINHIFGNEAASALKSKRDNGGLGDQTEDAFLHEWRVAKRQQIVDGKLGTRAGGPRVDPLTKEFQHQVALRVNAYILTLTDSAGNKMRLPKDKDATIQIGSQTRTWNQMFQNALANPKHAEPAMAAAKRITAERERADKQAARAGGENLEDAGF